MTLYALTHKLWKKSSKSTNRSQPQLNSCQNFSILSKARHAKRAKLCQNHKSRHKHLPLIIFLRPLALRAPHLIKKMSSWNKKNRWKATSLARRTSSLKPRVLLRIKQTLPRSTSCFRLAITSQIAKMAMKKVLNQKQNLLNRNQWSKRKTRQLSKSLQGWHIHIQGRLCKASQVKTRI